jgi:hypothetical protein
VEATKKLAAAVAGSLECCYFAFGGDGLYAIVDSPSYEPVVLLTEAQIDAGANLTIDHTPPGG